jgi:hypothetical protein
MENKPKVLIRFMKHADMRNKIIIPQSIVDAYGKDFYLEVYDDGTIRLTPIKDKKETEE